MGMIKSKKLSKVRSVTIPKDLAAKAGFFAGTAVDLIETGNGVLIRNHTPTCTVCGSMGNVKAILGREVCAGCAEKMKKEIEEKYA